MMTEEQAKGIIESLTPLQEAGERFPCPRCGHDRMDEKPVRNALSRRADVYICNQCGMEEALLDMARKPPTPFTQWGMVLSFDQEGGEEDEQRCRVCGCTDDCACPGGCYWVEEDLCSRCAEKLKGSESSE